MSVSGGLVPSAEHAEAYLAALREARDTIEAEYRGNRAYYDKLWKPLSLRDVTAFVDLVSWSLAGRAYQCAYHRSREILAGFG